MAVATRWPLVGRRDEIDAFSRALADPGCQAVCIYGPPGVGKTRLGDECLDVAAASGRRALRAAADRADAGAEIPFGPVIHLLPAHALGDLGDGDTVSPAAFARVLDATRGALAPAAGESGPPVLLLDDAHRADGWSLRMVDHLLDHQALVCVATVVSGEPVPETVLRWWRDERGVRLDLADLDQTGVDTLLHIALEGPVDGAAADGLWQASRGNLLALRELVLGAGNGAACSAGTACGPSTARSGRPSGCASWSTAGWPPSIPRPGPCSSTWPCASRSGSASWRRPPAWWCWRTSSAGA